MKKNKNQIPFPHETEKDYDNFYTANSGSFTDCTGLMYKPPENEFEYESYGDVYNFSSAAEIYPVSGLEEDFVD